MALCFTSVFDFAGQASTYWHLYFGWGLLVALLLLTQSLTLWVLATNIPAKRFYESLGFSLDGTTKTDKRPDGFKFHEERYRLQL